MRITLTIEKEPRAEGWITIMRRMGADDPMPPVVSEQSFPSIAFASEALRPSPSIYADRVYRLGDSRYTCGRRFSHIRVYLTEADHDNPDVRLWIKCELHSRLAPSGVLEIRLCDSDGKLINASAMKM